MKSILNTAARSALLLGILLSAASCASSRFASDVKASDINAMVLFQTDSYVDHIWDDGVRAFDEDETSVAAGLLVKSVLSLGLPVKGLVGMDDSETAEMKAFMQALIPLTKKEALRMKIPALLDQRLERDGFRYGLIVVGEGMTRSAKNFRKQVFAGVAIGVITTILSLGTVTYTMEVMRHSSSIWTAVIDSQEDRIIFYGASEGREISPVDEKGSAPNW